MGFWKDVRPLRAVREAAEIARDTDRSHLLPALLALAFPTAMIGLFIWQDEVVTAPPADQKIVYAESWIGERSDEEILKDRWEIQCRKDAKREEMRQAYKALGRATGLDVDKIEREAEANRVERENLPGQEYADC